MLMPARSFTASTDYRYGFNGKEKDKNIGSLTDYDYGFRIYNPAIGKFLSVDPLTQKYPYYSPYHFASNNPIITIDIDGLESSIKINPTEIITANPNANRIILANKYGLTPEERANFPTYYRNALKRDAENDRAAMRALGKVGLIAGAVALDVFVTKGWATRTVLIYETSSAFEHNRATTPEGREEQNQRSKQYLTNAFLIWGGGKFAESIAPVTKYMSGTFIIGFKTLSNVTKHLESLGFVSDEGNQIMLAKMRMIVTGEIKQTQIDINFARHELREAELLKKGMTYEEAHEAVLKEQGMYHPGYESKLYTKEALGASNAAMEREIKLKEWSKKIN